MSPARSWFTTAHCGCRRCRWCCSRVATSPLCSAHPGSELSVCPLVLWLTACLPAIPACHGPKAAGVLPCPITHSEAAAFWLGCRLGVEPIAIHMTWQRWARAGKVARLREFGLWRMDPPAYYGAGPHNTSTAYLAEGGDDRLWLLTYQNDVEEFVERMARQRYEGGRMPLFYKHWLGMSYQLAAFRWAVVQPASAAKQLNAAGEQECVHLLLLLPVLVAGNRSSSGQPMTAHPAGKRWWWRGCCGARWCLPRCGAGATTTRCQTAASWRRASSSELPWAGMAHGLAGGILGRPTSHTTAAAAIAT